MAETCPRQKAKQRKKSTNSDATRDTSSRPGDFFRIPRRRGQEKRDGNASGPDFSRKSRQKTIGSTNCRLTVQ
jgi:hypothetical protein